MTSQGVEVRVQEVSVRAQGVAVRVQECGGEGT